MQGVEESSSERLQAKGELYRRRREARESHPTLPDQGPPNSVSAVKAWQRVYTLAMSYGILERGTRVRFRSQLQVKVQTDTIFSLQ